MNIKEALSELDALDDDQWTNDGAPKLDAVSELVGVKVKRQEVVDAAPEFSRENMVVQSEAGEASGEYEPEVIEELETDLSAIEKYLEGDPMIEVEFIPFLMSLDPELLEVLNTVLTEQLDEAEKALSRATDLKGRLKRSRSYTRNRIKVEVPDMSNQQAIQHFIKSQTETRAAKIIKTRELLQGVDLKSLDPRAAIDRAMARKNTRGSKRPARPLMGR